MHIALSLAVGLTFLAAQCCSRSLGEDDRHYPVEALLYQQPIDEGNLKRAQEQQLSRGSGQYEYKYQTDTAYESETLPQKQEKKSPVVEQYLKEVTPTTRTAYEPQNQGQRQPTKNRLVQYTYQSGPLDEPYYQQYLEGGDQQQPKGAPVASNILAYHNALLAQQNAQYEKQRLLILKQQQAQQRKMIQDQQARAPIPDPFHVIHENLQAYVPPPQPVKTAQKPKLSTLDEEIAYFTKLKLEQERKQQEQVKKQPIVKYQEKPRPNVEEYSVIYRPEVQFNPPEVQLQPVSKPKEQIYISDVKFEKKTVTLPQRDDQYYQGPQVVKYEYEPIEAIYDSEDENPRYRQEQVQHPVDQTFKKYKANVAKYHSIPEDSQSHKSAKVTQQLYLHQPQPQQQRYENRQHYPKPEEIRTGNGPVYYGPSDEEYQQSEFKKSLGRNSSLRVLKTGKPVVFIGHEE